MTSFIYKIIGFIIFFIIIVIIGILLVPVVLLSAVINFGWKIINRIVYG